MFPPRMRTADLEYFRNITQTENRYEQVFFVCTAPANLRSGVANSNRPLNCVASFPTTRSDSASFLAFGSKTEGKQVHEIVFVRDSECLDGL